MDSDRGQQIVPGVSLTASGQATVDPALAETLFDLALELEASTNLPVDVEHVLAAIVLAARKQELHRDAPISSSDPTLQKLLIRYVKAVFADYGGKVGSDDEA